MTRGNQAAPGRRVARELPRCVHGGARGRRRAAAAAAGAVGIALLLGGCTSLPAAPAWAPRDVATAALQIGAGSDPSTPSTAPLTPPATPTAPGLDVRLLYSDAAGVAARWGEIPGNQPFTDTLLGRVTAAIAEHTAATGTPYAPAADAPTLPPEARGCVHGSTTRPATDLLADPAFTPPGSGKTLTIICEVVAAAGSVLVEALRILTADAGQVTADSTTVYYADTAGAFSTTSDTLLSDDGLRTLLGLVVQSLKVRAGALQPEMVQSVDEFPVDQLRTLFAHFSFAADGALVVHLPSDFSTPELDRLAGATRPDPFFVTVPAATATGLLTEQGAQVQSVLASGAPLTLPPAPWRGAETVDCALFACVAVTFDDGPGDDTAEVLDALDARRAAATFFLQGVNVGRHRDEVARMHAESHEIGNHTWNHPDLTKLPDPDIADQLARTSQAIQDATGQRPSTFRPPYGAVDPRVLAQTELPAILWTIDTNDWQLPDDATLLDRAVDQPKPGAIILLHDVHENTARMTPAILDGLLGRGYTLVTVQQLLGGTVPAAHTTTSRGENIQPNGCAIDSSGITYNQMVAQLMSETEADAVFHALADTTRRDIVRRALRREQSISSLAERYTMSFAAVQKHVAVLERSTLVVKERRGKEQIVRANLDTLRRATQLLDRFEVIWRDRVLRMDGLLAEDAPAASAATPSAVAPPTTETKGTNDARDQH